MTKQLEIAGTELPKNADIELAIDDWLEAKDEQKYATEKTKIKHGALLTHMQNAGVDAYPFTCPKTGKKRQVVIARDPKAKSRKAPRPSRTRDDDADIGEEVVLDDPDAVDNVVEMRRVKRASVEAEIDPFGATRAAMEPANEQVQVNKPNGKSNGTKPKKGKRGK